MDITITDNGDGTYQLSDADRQTLAAAILITPLFNGGTDTVEWNNPFRLNNNTTYDPVAQAAALQAQIDALTAQIAPIQTMATAFQARLALQPMPKTLPLTTPTSTPAS